MAKLILLSGLAFCVCVSVIQVTMARPADDKPPKPWTWNSILNAKGIFPDNLDPIKTNSKQPEDVVAELKTVLDNPENLKVIYAKYKVDFKKDKLTDRDDAVHSELLKNQLLDIAKHNTEADNGKHTWWMGVNQFTDMSEEERKRSTGGLRRP